MICKNSCQWSVVSGQLAVVSWQWSVGSGQLAVVSLRRGVGARASLSSRLKKRAVPWLKNRDFCLEIAGFGMKNRKNQPFSATWERAYLWLIVLLLSITYRDLRANFVCAFVRVFTRFLRAMESIEIWQAKRLL